MTTHIELVEITKIEKMPQCEYCLESIAHAMKCSQSNVYLVSGTTKGCYEHHFYETLAEAKEMRNFFNL